MSWLLAWNKWRVYRWNISLAKQRRKLLSLRELIKVTKGISISDRCRWVRWHGNIAVLKEKIRQAKRA